MSLRRARPADSLDMLLDTITNVFGGIVFIAILVVLLTRNQVQQASDRARTAADYLINLETDVAEARLRAARKRELAEYLESLTSRPPDAWARTAEQLDADIAAARERLARARRELAYMRDRRRPIDRKLRMAADHVQRLRAEIRRLEAVIQRERDLRRLKARLPVAHVTYRHPVHVVLTRGRMFIVDGCDGGLEAILDSDARDVDLVSLPGRRSRIVLLPGGGTPINEDLPASRPWRELLRMAPPSRHFIQFAVLPDAYEEFLFLRQLAVSSGYEYEVTPVPAADDLILSPTSQLFAQ